MGGKAAVLALTLALLAGLAAQDARPQLEVVRVSRLDAGGTTPFDSGRVEKNYQKAAADAKRALSSIEKKAAAKSKKEDGFDSGLPDPTRSSRRTWRPSVPLPDRIRGLTITVVTVDPNGIVHGLPKDPLGRFDLVLISRAARLKDCARLGRVTFLTRELAASLGIRSSRCRCAVSADGTEIEITEGDAP